MPWAKAARPGADRQTDRGPTSLRRGARDHGDKGMLSDWRSPPRPAEKWTEQGSRIAKQCSKPGFPF